MNYTMHNINKTITELLSTLKNTDKSIPNTNDVLIVQKGKEMHYDKAKPKFFGKDKERSKHTFFKPKPKVT